MKHDIIIDRDEGVNELPGAEDIIIRAANTALSAEGINTPVEIDVLITDDDGIRGLNRDFRGKDNKTDVLSFPQYDLMPGSPLPADVLGFADPGTGQLLLGDMAISVERCIAQAGEYGHSPEREIAYLTIHSVLHLLGYDHVDEAEDKKKMRTQEKLIFARYIDSEVL